VASPTFSLPKCSVKLKTKSLERSRVLPLLPVLPTCHIATVCWSIASVNLKRFEPGPYQRKELLIRRLTWKSVESNRICVFDSVEPSKKTAMNITLKIADTEKKEELFCNDFVKRVFILLVKLFFFEKKVYF